MEQNDSLPKPQFNKVSRTSQFLVVQRFQVTTSYTESNMRDFFVLKLKVLCQIKRAQFNKKIASEFVLKTSWCLAKRQSLMTIIAANSRSDQRDQAKLRNITQKSQGIYHSRRKCIEMHLIHQQKLQNIHNGTMHQD